MLVVICRGADGAQPRDEILGRVGSRIAWLVHPHRTTKLQREVQAIRVSCVAPGLDVLFDSALLSYEDSKPRLDQDDAANIPALPDPALLLGDDAPAFARALAAYKAGDFAAGEFAVAELRAPLPALAARWAGLRLHPREAGFCACRGSCPTNRIGRPAIGCAATPRRRCLATTTPTRPLIILCQEKPSTPRKIALARVLPRRQFDAAGALVRQLWREEDFNETIEGVLRKEFSDFLTVADHKIPAPFLFLWSSFRQAEFPVRIW